MQDIPQDPVIFLSFINAKLRDHFDSLEEFANYYQQSVEDIHDRLATIDYYYSIEQNQFI